MSTSVSEIKYLVYHDPRPLKFMFKNPTEDKRRLSAIIGRLIPYRIGIEFELFGTLSHLSNVKFPVTKKSGHNSINSIYNKLSKEEIIKQSLKKKFNLVDYSEDKYQYWTDNNEADGELNEIRVSFKGVHQLTSLWNVCKALNENCKIPSKNGGIHIHIDISELKSHHPDSYVESYAKKFLSRDQYLSRVLNIFGGYKGTYNKRGVHIKTKGRWINISSKNTIEFRIGRLTFNYRTIIRWIIELSKIVTEIKTSLYNNVKLDDNNLRKTSIVSDDTALEESAYATNIEDNGELISSVMRRVNDLSILTSNGTVWHRLDNDTYSTAYI